MQDCRSRISRSCALEVGGGFCGCDMSGDVRVVVGVIVVRDWISGIEEEYSVPV